MISVIVHYVEIKSFGIGSSMNLDQVDDSTDGSISCC